MKTTRQPRHAGITSRCDDGLHVMFLDYDLATPDRLEFVANDVQFLQNLYGAGTAYVFATRHGFHVMFLEKHYIDETYDLMRHSASDMGHHTVPMYGVTKQWVLRVTKKRGEKKIRYLGKIDVPTPPPFERSRAHANFLYDYYNVPEEHLRCKTGQWFDDNNNVRFVTYPKKRTTNINHRNKK